MQAQRVQVRVVDSLSGAPVAGAVLTLLDSAGHAAAEGLSDAAGQRVLAPPAASVYSIRVRRIGFAPFISDTLMLRAAATALVARALTLRVSSRRLVLPAVTVLAAGKACASSAAGNGTRLPSEMLWDAIRTSLKATDLTRRDSLAPADIRIFADTLDADNRLVGRMARDVGVTRARPFPTPAPGVLSKQGFIDQSGLYDLYYAPDERVLLSPEFEADHCFSLLAAGSNQTLPTAVGLAFTPTAARLKAKIPEVTGALWVDTTTMELRRIEFQYVNAHLRVGADSIGGQLEFTRLASGAWIVSRWTIRMPRVGATSSIYGMQYMLDGYLESGGTATVAGASTTNAAAATSRAAGRQSATPVRATTARITGVVFDSLLNAPLPGAVVQVAGLELGAVTDSVGQFTLPQVPVGTRRLVVYDRALDSLGLPAVVQGIGQTVVARGGDTARVVIATPSLTTLEHGACADSSDLLIGTVRDVRTGAPVPKAQVEVQWLNLAHKLGAGTQGVEAAVQRVISPTDSSGRYVTCVAPHAEVVARATPGAAASAVTGATSGDGKGTTRYAPTGALDVVVGPRHLATLDFALAPVQAGVEARPGTLQGRVLDATQRPAVGATISYVGTDDIAVNATTDEAGRYMLRHLPAGSAAVSVRKVGFQPLNYDVVIRPDSVTTLDTQLGAVRLATVHVSDAEAKRRQMAWTEERSEFQHRRQLGLGFGLDSAEIAKIPFINAGTLVGALPGVRIGYSTAGVSGFVFPQITKMDDPGQIANMGCAGTLYVDGYETSPDQLNMYSPQEIAAVEVFAHPDQAPLKYVKEDTNCGIIMIWTYPGGRWQNPAGTTSINAPSRPPFD